MSITVHIERLVLDEALVGSRRPERMAAVIEAELASLLRADGVASDARVGRGIATTTGTALTIAPGARAERVGSDIAGAIYDALGRVGSAPGTAATPNGQRGERI